MPRSKKIVIATLGDILKAANPHLATSLLAKEFANVADQPFEEWLHKNTCSALDLNSILQVRLMVVSSIKNVQGLRLIYDGRFHNTFSEDFSSFCVIILDWKGRFVRKMNDIGNLTPLRKKKDQKKHIAQPLWQLLNLTEEKPDPQLPEDLMRYLDSVNWKEPTRVHAYFVYYKVNKTPYYGFKFTWGDPFKAKKRIVLEVNTRTDYGITYRFRNNAWQPQRKEPEVPQEKEKYPDPSSMNPFHKNRSSCLKVKRFGLNLAFDLGLLSSDNFSDLSQKLAATAATLVLQCDEHKKPRYVTYVDDCCSFGSEVDIENTANNKALVFFQMVFERMAILTERRRNLLDPLIGRLEKSGAFLGNLYRTCRTHLRNCIPKQTLVLYCNDDTDLRHLMGFLGQEFFKTNPKSRIYLRYNATNDLIALSCSKFEVVNFKHYLDLDCYPTFANLRENAPLPAENMKKRKDVEGDNLTTACSSYGTVLGNCLLESWIKFGKYLQHWFKYEFHSLKFQPLSTLVYNAVQSAVLTSGNCLTQGKEKVKPWYSKILRENLRGGFLFSAVTKFEQGDVISCDSDGQEYTAKSVWEYDVNSSYGWCGSVSQLPGGFCVGYCESLLPEKKGELIKADGLRSNSYEFRATFYTLLNLEKKFPEKKIKSVYSNYHPKGLFAVNKCYIDLAVIFDNSSVALWNFDPAYTHGCPNKCPRLKSYICDLSYEAVRSKTLERDSVINKWIDASDLDITYQVITDCCTPEYSPKLLKKAFFEESRLAHLNQVCPEQTIYTWKEMDAWLTRNQNDQRFTYIAWIEGGLPDHLANDLTPLILHPKEWTRSGQSLESSTKGSHLMLTREYYEFLKTNFKFETLGIKGILFFGKDKMTSEVYKKLTEQRYTTEDKTEVEFLKKVLNLSLGYYAIKAQGSRKKVALIHHYPKKATILSHTIQAEYGAFQCADGQALLVSTVPTIGHSKKNVSQNTNCLSYLPLYAAVIERGKQRLVEFVVFLQKHLHPNKFALIFSNTDSVQFVCSEPNWMDSVKPEQKASFDADMPKLIAREKRPGFFKLEWSAKDNFKYVTAMIQNYSILHANYQGHKWSGINKLRHEEAYEKSCKLLDNVPFEIEQERRVDKIRNLETVTKRIRFNARATPGQKHTV